MSDKTTHKWLFSINVFNLSLLSTYVYEMIKFLFLINKFCLCIFFSIYRYVNSYNCLRYKKGRAGHCWLERTRNYCIYEIVTLISPPFQNFYIDKNLYKSNVVPFKAQLPWNKNGFYWKYQEKGHWILKWGGMGILKMVLVKL